MELFLVGFICGIALAVSGFVLLNLERPADVDEVEDTIRDKTIPYENAKADVKARVRKLRKEKA